MDLLQALYDVRDIVSFNAFKMIEVAVARCALQSVGGGLLTEVLAHSFSYLVHFIYEISKRGCVSVLLVSDVICSGGDGRIHGNITKASFAGLELPRLLNEVKYYESQLCWARVT